MFNAFINSLDAGLKHTLSKFTYNTKHYNTKYYKLVVLLTSWRDKREIVRLDTGKDWEKKKAKI